MRIPRAIRHAAARLDSAWDSGRSASRSRVSDHPGTYWLCCSCRPTWQRKGLAYDRDLSQSRRGTKGRRGVFSRGVVGERVVQLVRDRGNAENMSSICALPAMTRSVYGATNLTLNASIATNWAAGTLRPTNRRPMCLLLFETFLPVFHDFRITQCVPPAREGPKADRPGVAKPRNFDRDELEAAELAMQRAFFLVRGGDDQ
jgi:hypothetical protein